VVADLGNSSGNAALDATMAGLSLLARQEVLRRMERLRRRTHLASASDPGSPQVMATWLKATLPLPRSVIDTKLTDVAKAIAEGIPEGAKPTAQLLSLLVVPRGTTVSGRLQMEGDLPGRAGISLEVADMEGLEVPRSDTFWEPVPSLPPTAEGTSNRGTSSTEGAPEEVPSSGNPPASNASGSGAGGEGTTGNAGVKEAAALRGLGLLYEQRGAFEQAKTFYEEAAKKDPEDFSSQKALLRVLSKRRRTPSERYQALLEPVCRWLATELLRDKLLFEVSRKPGEDGRRRRAQVHNFVGSYHTYGDPNHDAFLRAAERELGLAIECDAEWYLPHANLGDVVSYMGYQRKDIASTQREAIAKYDAALERLKKTPPEEALPSAEDRIRLSRSIAQLLSDDPPSEGKP
jgi:hypothetical protein